jgi:hypothetical protein
MAEHRHMLSFFGGTGNSRKGYSRYVENRFILLGISSGLRLLVVCHCYREDDMIIRIISARKANKQEQKQYGSFLL